MLSVSICKTTPSLSFCVPSSSSPSSFVVEVDVRCSTRTHPNCSPRRGPTPLLLAFLLLLPSSKTRTRFDAWERLFSGDDVVVVVVDDDDVYFRVASRLLLYVSFFHQRKGGRSSTTSRIVVAQKDAAFVVVAPKILIITESSSSSSSSSSVAKKGERDIVA